MPVTSDLKWYENNTSSNLGRVLTAEHKAKLSASALLRYASSPVSEETKAKISAASITSWKARRSETTVIN